MGVCGITFNLLAAVFAGDNAAFNHMDIAVAFGYESFGGLRSALTTAAQDVNAGISIQTMTHHKVNGL